MHIQYGLDQFKIERYSYYEKTHDIVKLICVNVTPCGILCKKFSYSTFQCKYNHLYEKNPDFKNRVVVIVIKQIK